MLPLPLPLLMGRALPGPLGFVASVVFTIVGALFRRTGRRNAEGAGLPPQAAS